MLLHILPTCYLLLLISFIHFLAPDACQLGNKDNRLILVAACKLRLKFLTCRTRFLLEPTRKMPTVFSPCSSRYLKSQEFDDADDYNHNKVFFCHNYDHLMQVLTTLGTQGCGFILSEGSLASSLWRV